jgi:hypothetical protein
MKWGVLGVFGVLSCAVSALAAPAPHLEQVTYDAATGAAIVVASVPRGQRVAAEHTDLLVSASVGYVSADVPMSLVESRSLLLRATTSVASPSNGRAWFAIDVPLANRPDLGVAFEVDVALPGLVGAGRVCAGGCSGHGVCAYGKCFCESGWVGDTCGQSSTCPAQCNAHGVCAYGKCFCTPGYQGDACDQPIPGACPNQCSDNGICIHGKCACVEGYTGDDCSVPVDEGACPNRCNDNGVCVAGRCACFPAFSGDDCSIHADDGACPNACSGQGICEFGKCFCQPGYTGDDCSEAIGTCPNDCSGRGLCQHGVCFCDPGFIGDDCSVPVEICPKCEPAPR